MASELSQYYADAILTALFHGTGMSVNTSLRIEICETVPSRADVGGVFTTYTSYAHQHLVTGASSEWAAPSTVSGARVTSNSAAVVFPTSTDTGTHSAVGYAVYDQDDHLVLIDSVAFDIAPGFTPRIEIGNLVFSFAAAANAFYALQDSVINVIFRNTALAALTSIDVEEYVTLPSKVDDTGGTKATYTGYADGTFTVGGTSDFDAIETSGVLRGCHNTAAKACGTANTSASQTLAGFVIRNNTGNGPLFQIAYSPTLPIAVGTTMNHPAASIMVRF